MTLSRRDVEMLFSIAADMFPGRAVPDWIRNHPAVKDRDIKKVFPGVGLKNFKELADIPAEHLRVDKDSDFVSETLFSVQAAMTRIYTIIASAETEFERESRYHISDALKRINALRSLENRGPGYVANLQDAYKLESELRNSQKIIFKKETDILDAISKFSSSISPDCVVATKDGRIELKMTVDIAVGDKNIIRVGNSIAAAYGRIAVIVRNLLEEMGSYEKVRDWDQISAIKKFNTENVPLSKELYVVFSSSGEKGAWDIATMSMRGLSSCQDWSEKQDQYNSCIVGSIASNYVGVIYLTSGKDFGGKGDKMIKRCVVRFGIDASKPKKERKPVIILDKMYTSYNEGIAKAFISALQSKTSLEILDFSKFSSKQDSKSIDYRIPEENLPNVVEKSERVPEDGYAYTSYLDTEFPPFKREQLHKEDDNVIRREKFRPARIVMQKLENKLLDLFDSIVSGTIDEDKKYVSMNGLRRSISKFFYKMYSNERIVNYDAAFINKYCLTQCLKLDGVGDLTNSTKQEREVAEKLQSRFRAGVRKLMES